MKNSRKQKQRQNITAIIYDKRGRVLSIGKNSYLKTHTLQAYYAKRVGMPEKQFLHAEIDAIIRCRDLSKAYSMFVSRIGNKGTPLLAKPCKICEQAIRAAGIKVVSWSINPDSDGGDDEKCCEHESEELEDLWYNDA